MSRQVVVKARAYSDGKTPSEVVTAVFTVYENYVLGYGKSIIIGYEDLAGYKEKDEHNDNNL